MEGLYWLMWGGGGEWGGVSAYWGGGGVSRGAVSAFWGTVTVSWHESLFTISIF